MCVVGAVLGARYVGCCMGYHVCGECCVGCQVCSG